MTYTPKDEFELNAENRMERKFERVPLGFAQNPRNPDVRWRIYYADVSQPNGYRTASNLEYPDPEDAPDQDIVCILQYMQDQEVDVVMTADVFESALPTVFGDVYFINEFGRWQSGWGPETLTDRVDRGIPFSAVKWGYWTDLENYRRIMLIAAFDTDMPSGLTYPGGENA